jgi:hypothetical protein
VVECKYFCPLLARRIQADYFLEQFNTPVQLGPSRATGTTPQSAGKIFSLPVQADDILVLATDGLSDNLWDDEILDEVVRFRRRYLHSSSNPSPSAVNSANPSPNLGPSRDEGYESGSAGNSPSLQAHSKSDAAATQVPLNGTSMQDGGVLWRRTLAGMLSEALCSRARSRATAKQGRRRRPQTASSALAAASGEQQPTGEENEVDENEIPFARRARESGKSFPKGSGKNDGQFCAPERIISDVLTPLLDISVVVAVISPVTSASGSSAPTSSSKDYNSYPVGVDISRSGILTALAQ